MSQPREMLHLLRKQDWVSAIQAREELGIQNPADAVYQLRKHKAVILTIRQIAQDSAGRMHICAHYHLGKDIADEYFQ